MRRPQAKSAGFWNRHSKKRWLLAGLVALAVLGQLAFNLYLYTQISYIQPSYRITDLIIGAARNVTKPVVIEPKERLAYIPEADLVLPYPPAAIGELRYGYFHDEASGDKSVQITTTRAIEAAANKLYGSEQTRYSSEAFTNSSKVMEEVFKDVPGLQACSRGMFVLFGDQPAPDYEKMKQVGTKQLADGRKATIYRDDACPHLPNVMTDYVNKLESY